MSDDGVSAILLLFKWEHDDTSLTKLGMPQTHRSSQASPVQVKPSTQVESAFDYSYTHVCVKKNYTYLTVKFQSLYWYLLVN